MGQQRRYARRVGDLEVPTTAGHRLRVEEAARKIAAHVREFQRPGIFAGDGTYRGSLADGELAELVLNDDRLRHGPNVDGSDTLLVVDPDEHEDDIRERLYRSRRWASPRAVARHEVAEAIYAAIGVGAMPAEPTQHIEALVGQLMRAMDRGLIDPRNRTYRCHGLRALLELPTADWDDAADRAAARGRRLCRDLERRTGGPHRAYVPPSLLDRYPQLERRPPGGRWR